MGTSSIETSCQNSQEGDILVLTYSRMDCFPYMLGCHSARNNGTKVWEGHGFQNGEGNTLVPIIDALVVVFFWNNLLILCDLMCTSYMGRIIDYKHCGPMHWLDFA